MRADLRDRGLDQPLIGTRAVGVLGRCRTSCVAVVVDRRCHRCGEESCSVPAAGSAQTWPRLIRAPRVKNVLADPPGPVWQTILKLWRLRSSRIARQKRGRGGDRGHLRLVMGRRRPRRGRSERAPYCLASPGRLPKPPGQERPAAAGTRPLPSQLVAIRSGVQSPGPCQSWWP